jgi:hypothetical protein
MSRTDVHTPMWAKKLQPEWRDFFVEWHVHTQHPCNFDVRNEDYRDCLLGMSSRRRNIHCGCAMCSGQIYRRLSRRANRYNAKRLLRSGRWDDVSGFTRWRY